MIRFSSRDLVLSHEANNGLTISQGRLSEEGSRHWADIKTQHSNHIEVWCQNHKQGVDGGRRVSIANLEPK